MRQSFGGGGTSKNAARHHGDNKEVVSSPASHRGYSSIIVIFAFEKMLIVAGWLAVVDSLLVSALANETPRTLDVQHGRKLTIKDDGRRRLQRHETSSLQSSCSFLVFGILSQFWCRYPNARCVVIPSTSFEAPYLPRTKAAKGETLLKPSVSLISLWMSANFIIGVVQCFTGFQVSCLVEPERLTSQLHSGTHRGFTLSYLARLSSVFAILEPSAATHNPMLLQSRILRLS